MLSSVYLLIGPVYFMPFGTSLGLIQGCMAVLGLSNGLILVSTFSSAQRAAIRNGFNNDIDTYLIISGNVHSLVGKAVKSFQASAYK